MGTQANAIYECFIEVFKIPTEHFSVGPLSLAQIIFKQI